MPPRQPRYPICGLLAALVFVLGLAPHRASAKDLNGKVGLGLEQSLSGVSGLTVRYWPLAEFGLAVTVGAELLIPHANDTSGRAVGTRIVASAGVLYNFARSLHANLGGGLRLGLGFNSADFERAVNGDQAASADQIQFMVEIPLTAEFFLSDNFSISLSTGILISIVMPDSEPVLEPDGHGNSTVPGVNIGIGTGSVTATLGVLYYF